MPALSKDLPLGGGDGEADAGAAGGTFWTSPHDKEIFALAIPALGSVLLDPLMGMVDTGSPAARPTTCHTNRRRKSSVPHVLPAQLGAAPALSAAPHPTVSIAYAWELPFFPKLNTEGNVVTCLQPSWGG